MKWIYKFTVILFFASLISCESFFNEDISNESVIIIAPVNDALLETNPIFFDWEEVEFATDYKLQIARPDFANAVQLVADTLLRSNTYSQELEPASYEWRINARNADYETNYATGFFRSTSDAVFANKVVSLITPLDNSLQNVNNIELEWNSVEDATEYRVQVEDANMMILDRNINSLTLSENLIDGIFTWRVRASNGAENTSYTSATFTIDTQAPSNATLLTPIDGNIENDNSINFTWTAAAASGTTEVDSIYIYQDQALLNLEFKELANANRSHVASVPIGNTYYWRIKSFDAAGNESNFSSVFSFLVN
jgi:hypothetical protein